MKVNFKSIKIEGFMSLGEVELDLQNKNVVLVEGRNDSGNDLVSNGSGKSCLFEAIYWNLTGKTVRGTKEVINRYYKGHTFVKLVLEVNGVEYVLNRYREHPDHGNNLVIYKNNEVISSTGIKKSEQVLHNELPFLTEDLIGSIIILGQGLPSKFTGYDPAGRKEILEVLSGNLGIIENMKDKIVSYKNKVSGIVNEKTSEVNRLESAIDLRRKDVREMEESLKDQVDDVDALKEEIRIMGDNKDVLIDKIEKSESLLDGVKNEVFHLGNEKTKISGKISNIENKIEEAKDELSSYDLGKCPTCGKDMTDQEELKALRDEVDKLVIDSEKELEEGNNRLSEISEDLSGYEEKYANLKNKISNMKEKTNQLEYDIIRSTEKLNVSSTLGDKIKQYEKEIQENDTKLFEVVSDMNKYIKKDKILSLLQREVGREFRGYVLKGVIEYLNILLKDYSGILFGKDNLILLLEDNKLYLQYEGRSYESLSGGERHRADIAMQFALREMLMQDLGYSFNILVLDEIFDNLDESGVEGLTRLLSENLESVESVFVVTHHSSLPLAYDSKLTVVKEMDNISKLGG